MNWEIELLFTALLALAYTWAGYPLLLWLLSKMFRRRWARGQNHLPFSIIVAVHNEHDQIGAKLQNCLSLRYPEEAMEIIVASDGSTDSTERTVADWAAGDQRIKLVRTEGRQGKSGAQNVAASQARGEILLFTDAGTRMQSDLLERIASDFAEPAVGMVAPVVQMRGFGGCVSRSQGAYWRFEVWLRQMESAVGILATASGSAFAVRRELFRPIPLQFGDDCIVPLQIRLQGFKILQDSEAVVFDAMPHSVEDELRTRIRMTTRNWSGTLSRSAWLNPLRFPGTTWGLLSHKVLRWLTPFLLAAAFVSNVLLAHSPTWALLLVLQAGFYGAAVIGWRCSRQHQCARIFGYPFAFCLANLGFLLGVVRSLRGQTVIAYK
ncbi:MAG TPA: glycosyltransferase [Terriglobales bacterium]|nr:glycosyltransferase [Terriglobales bacterium]